MLNYHQWESHLRLTFQEVLTISIRKMSLMNTLVNGYHMSHWVTELTCVHYDIALNHVHDDAIKWKHFPRYWPFVKGIHWSPVNSPYKGHWRGTLMFFFYLHLNKRLSKLSRRRWFETPSRPLGRHCNVLYGTKLHFENVVVSVTSSLIKSSFFFSWYMYNNINTQSYSVPWEGEPVKQCLSSWYYIAKAILFYTKHIDNSVNITAKTTRRIFILMIRNCQNIIKWYNLIEEHFCMFWYALLGIRAHIYNPLCNVYNTISNLTKLKAWVGHYL